MDDKFLEVDFTDRPDGVQVRCRALGERTWGHKSKRTRRTIVFREIPSQTAWPSEECPAELKISR